MEDTSLVDVWVESGVFSQRVAENIMKGKQWSRIFRAHKVTFDAMWIILWPLLLEWCEANDYKINRKKTSTILFMRLQILSIAQTMKT